MTSAVPTCVITSSAPGKVILFGEHSVNRGQLALSAALGRRVTCALTPRDDGRVVFRGAGRELGLTIDDLRSHTHSLDAALASEDFAVIAAALRDRFFASSLYVLGRADAAGLPFNGWDVSFESELTVGGGLGSGGAVHAALAVALGRAFEELNATPPDSVQIADWAFSGDRIAHGGTASALDTQTSLLGGVIEFRAGSAGRTLSVAPGLRLVIGDTGVKKGSTGSVNARVRDWLAADRSRIRAFHEMGELAAAAREQLRAGNWSEMGALMNRNHRLLAEIGASHPRLEALCDAARAAGALGAKLTGAGGGGAMIALVTDRSASAVASALRASDGVTIEGPVAGPGAAVDSVEFV